MKESINKPIVLIGIMGSGKSTIGKKLAKKLRLQFYDSDREIESREGVSVIDIYDFKGEEYFKKKEEEIVKEILGYGITLLSTGSSTFLNDELRAIIKKNAISIWLSADLDTLYNRVIRRNTRPELDKIDNKKELLEKMMEERYPVYSQADITVMSQDLDTHYVVDTVIAKLRKFLQEHNI